MNAIDVTHDENTRQRPAKPRVLHISADFPDPVNDDKTRAVLRLLDLTAEDFDHRTISLNRSQPPLTKFLGQTLLNQGRPPAAISSGTFPYGEWWTYEAPSHGLFLKSCLVSLADAICRTLDTRTAPDIVVGHKLTVEGIVARRIAAHLSVPFAVGIMGDTDLKIARARPDLADDFRKVLHEASAVYSLAPWSLTQLEKRFGARRGPSWIVPCATDADHIIPPRAGGDGLVSMFHLKNHARKNLSGMLGAYRKVRDRGLRTTLTILGGGDEAQVKACTSAARGIPGVQFAGPLGRAEIGPRLNRATGFVLPSLRESFGMVFLEALFAGIPIIYPRGAAVDGYFDGQPFARAVDARDEDEIADAMSSLVENETAIKASLTSWQATTDAKRFTRTAIGENFASLLRAGATT